MSSVKRSVLRSSILRKEVVALTSLFLTGFIFVHLAGVLLVFLGPNFFNAYTKKLHGMPELIWSVRIGLILSFTVHTILTIVLTIENWRAQKGRYEVRGSKCEEGITFAKRTMIYSGLLLIFFVGFHLNDFSLAEKDGPDSVIILSEETYSLPVNLGLYGLVWKSFLNPWRVGMYILAMFCVGLHLVHGIQSLFQSLGMHQETLTPPLRRLSIVLGILIMVGFCAVPIYIYIMRVPPL